MNRLKLWRIQAGLSQPDAARLLKMGESTLSLFESGRLTPSPRQLGLFRAHFGQEADTLFEPVRDRVKVSA